MRTNAIILCIFIYFFCTAIMLYDFRAAYRGHNKYCIMQYLRFITRLYIRNACLSLLSRRISVCCKLKRCYNPYLLSMYK